MTRSMFNNCMEFDIEKFQGTMYSMETESSKEVVDEPFIHMIHDIPTGKDGNN